MSDAAGRVADSTGNWVDSLAPAWLRPYLRLARLDRPIGSWLLLIAVLVVARARRRSHAGKPVSIWHVVLFFIGAFAMRGAGCTWNDIVDRDLDAMVERTRSRPIPSGQVSVQAAAAFLVAAGAGRACGAAAVQRASRSLTGIASLAIVAIYPFMKRITYWPQIVLGLAFSWGALMGWPAAFGRLDLAGARALCRLDRLGDRLRHDLRASGSRGRCADRHQIDRDPVRRAHQADARGVLHARGRADRRSPDGVPAPASCSRSGCSRSPRSSSWQISRFDIGDPDLCLRLFKSNRDAGLILFAAMVLDVVVRRAVA